MKNLITQDGCWNCRHRKQGYDIETAYEGDSSIYCNYNKDCPAKYRDWEFHYKNGKDVAKYDENYHTINDDFLMRRCQKLYKWERSHEVHGYKKCDYYKAE